MQFSTSRTTLHDDARALEVDALVQSEADLRQQLEAALKDAAAWRVVATEAIHALAARERTAIRAEVTR